MTIQSIPERAPSRPLYFAMACMCLADAVQIVALSVLKSLRIQLETEPKPLSEAVICCFGATPMALLGMLFPQYVDNWIRNQNSA